MRNSTQKFNLIQKNSSSYFHIEFINTFAGIKVCDLLSKIYADGQKKNLDWIRIPNMNTSDLYTPTD